jgi:hypothetical protein
MTFSFVFIKAILGNISLAVNPIREGMLCFSLSELESGVGNLVLSNSA